MSNTGLVITVFDAVLAFRLQQLLAGDRLVVAALLTLALVALGALVCLGRQPRNERQLSFQVPLVPYLPLLSVFINVYLMFNLSAITWRRFAYWMIFGGCH